MEDIPSVIATGLVSGSTYALLGLSIVIIFRATDVMNFAQGDMGTVGVFVAAWLVGLGVSIWIGLIIAVIASGLVGLATERLVIRSLGPGRMFVAMVATLGLSVVIQVVLGTVWGFRPRAFPALVDGTINFLGVELALQKILTTVVALVAIALVAVFFQRSMLGVTMRASAEDHFAARVVGIDNLRVARIAWFLGCALSGMGAFFVAADSALVTHLMTPSLFRSFAGVMFGGLTSVAGAPVGGMLVGILDNIAGVLSAGFRDTVVFAIIIAVLFLRPEGIAGTERRGRV